jgi:RNA polymerase sigma factor (sigma-70 family)
MKDDAELLRGYAEDQIESAFAELVGRHLNLVYSAALRQVGGDAYLAQDVAQMVFTDLARKSHSLLGRRVLAGWLYTSTRYAAAQVVRAERRRRTREQEAHTMNEISSAGGSANDWAQLQPVLDEAMHALREHDREAVLLRFFSGHAFAAIGTQLGISEEAARKRVNRALDELRAALARQGVTSTASALALLLAERGAVAAPAGMAATVTSAALIHADGAVLPALAKLVIAVGGAIAVVTAALFIWQQHTDRKLQQEIEALWQTRTGLARAQIENQQRTQSKISSTAPRNGLVNVPTSRGPAPVVTATDPNHASADPRLSIASARTVNAFGKVKESGLVPMSDETMTLQNVIDRVGGLTSSARSSAIKVTRRLPDGSTKVFSVDFATEASRFVVEPNDTIYVPEQIL